MLPPFPGSLPSGVVRIPAHRLTVGDIVFLESAASGEPVRSLILEVRGRWFKVMNRLNPDPYEILLPEAKMVWALKIRPFTPRRSPCTDEESEREPSFRRPNPSQSFRSPFVEFEESPEDFSSYWNWDPLDSRRGRDFYSIEEQDWQRLKKWWEAKKREKKSERRKAARKSRIDPNTIEWYKVLNVRAGVTIRELKAAYRRAAFRYHPDRCKELDAAEKFKQISAAYRGLLALLERKQS